MKLVVFDVETDKLLSKARNNWDELRVTVCVAIECVSLTSQVNNRDSVQEFVLFDDAINAADTDSFGKLMDDADVVVAYNGREFDLRVLRNHYASERVYKWAAKLLDPFEVIRDATGSWVKLDELLDANGLPRKPASGVDAVNWWKDGEQDKVIEYCKHDVLGLQRIVAMDRIRFPVKRLTTEGLHVVDRMCVIKWHNYCRRTRPCL